MNNNFPLKFDLEAAQKASDEWGANCGPGALAAMLGMTLDEVRPHLGNFESKGYMNPKLMIDALESLNVNFVAKKHNEGRFYESGLARVQWEGPWTEPGVDRRKRYRHTHWVGFKDRGRVIFDINCIDEGGWISKVVWERNVVPYLLKKCEPEASGKWHLTHVIEITRTNEHENEAMGIDQGDTANVSDPAG